MKLEGKVFRANLLLQSFTIEQPDTDQRFSLRLERCLVALCHTLEIPLPLWMEKNTREFARFHQTIFFADQFMDPIQFERFQIRLID